jgi:bacterial leucyl aminopeptidase
MSYQVVKRAFAVFFCLSVFIVFGNSVNARGVKHWVSVDAAELDSVAVSLKARNGKPALNEHISRIVNGIAILQLDDEQMEDLSRGMHENFHKCGGFVEHSSEAEAIAWIERLSLVDMFTPAVIYTIDNQAAVTALHTAARETDNRQTILDLSAFPNRRYNQASGLDSANWIKNKWTQLAAIRGTNNTVESFSHPTNISPQPSVILTIRGSVYPDEVVILGAHQDSINLNGQTQPAPGADDDASGIACLTEIIRVLTSSGFRPARTVKFMAYAAEEVGLRGSNAIAAAFRAANTNVVGVMQLDMTNYLGTQGYDIVMITDFTNAAQNQFIRDLITAYQPGLVVGNSTCGYACSDHSSWTDRSYPASFPFEAPIGNDNPWIHTSTDTIARSNNNANQALPFTKLGLSYVAELAKGCISRRVACNSAEPARTAPSALKFSNTDKGNFRSMLVDAMSH